MTSLPKPEVRFKENLDDFFNHLISIITTHGSSHFVPVESICALRDLLAAYPIDTVMVLFVNNTQQTWNKIKERDPLFFNDFQTVLRQIPVKEISSSNLLFNIMSAKKDGQFIVSESERDVMWQYCESFVYILVDYIHHTRVPKTRVLPTGKKQAVYSRQFLPSFNIREHSRVWSIDLQF